MVLTVNVYLHLGDNSYDSMDYSGTVFANTDTCNGYLGFVFGYQSNRKFYVAIWRHNHLNYPPDYAAGIQGLQIKVKREEVLAIEIQRIVCFPFYFLLT